MLIHLEKSVPIGEQGVPIQEQSAFGIKASDQVIQTGRILKPAVPRCIPAAGTQDPRH